MTLNLGEWETKDLFGLAVATSGSIIIGAIVHRGWNGDTFAHESWGFDWEELAALLYLMLNYRTDRAYTMKLKDFYDVIMQPHSPLRLHRAVRGEIYDTSTWIAVAHSLLD